jgi:hypothetical protein
MTQFKILTFLPIVFSGPTQTKDPPSHVVPNVQLKKEQFSKTHLGWIPQTTPKHNVVDEPIVREFVKEHPSTKSVRLCPAKVPLPAHKKPCV